MRKLIVLYFSICATSSVIADVTPQGYVLKAGEGESVAGSLIKASPKSGTQNSVMILQPMPAHASTGLHYHLKADELFFVVSGTGTATLGDVDYPIEEGDVIFIPVGLDHEMTANNDRLILLEFKDLPGLDEEFRVWHKRFIEDGEDPTLEKLNEFAKPLGTIYKTID